MSQTSLLSLHTQLKNFGLNPDEWSLERTQSLRYKIKNNLDQGFVILGYLTFHGQAYHWESLEIISL